jgi:hypothetical protein
MAKHISLTPLSGLLDEHQSAREKIFEYFGYVEDWCVYPIEDARCYIWYTDGDRVVFGDEDAEPGDHYSNTVYRQRFLPKWVYEGDEFTMILVDTHVDGNKFLQIFDNSKRLSKEQAEAWLNY